jgi:hypothetical protein
MGTAEASSADDLRMAPGRKFPTAAADTVALSLLSTPGSLPRLPVSSSYRALTSFDGERSFSAGKHRCNRLQHAQSVATFQAKVSLASWIQDNAIFTEEDALVSRAAAILKTGKIGAEKQRAREAEIMLIDEDEE